MPEESDQLSLLEKNLTPPVEVDSNLSSYGGIGEYDFESVTDALTSTSTSILPLDENFKKMVDSASESINQFPIGALGNIKSSYPGTASTTYNPLSQQQPPDLNTEEGKMRLINSIGEEMDDISPTTKGYEDPVESSVIRSNFDRYWTHPKFNKLGWHPYSNADEHYNRNSTNWDDNIRMRSQWVNLFSTGFTSVYRSLGDLFSSEHNYTDPDLISAHEFEEAMRIGNSTRPGGVASWKFVNNLALNSAYTFGILGSIAVEEVALLGMTAAATAAGGPAAGAPVAGAAAVRSGQNALRAGRAVLQWFDVFRISNATRNLVRTMKNAEKAKDFWFGTKATGKFVGDIFAPETLYALKNWKTAANAATNMSSIAKINRTFGGFYRDLRMINLAMAESKMEAGMVYNNTLHENHRNYMEKNEGDGPDVSEYKKMENSAAQAAYWANWLNFPVIYFTNRLVLDGALRGFKPMGKVMDETVSGIGRHTLRRRGALKEGMRRFFDPGTGLKRVINIGLTGNARALGVGALRYMSANLAEGFQEITQEAIAVGTQDYFTGLYEDPAMGGIDAQHASIGIGVDSQMSQQGWEVFMSGFLMGGLVQGPQKVFFTGLPNLYTRIATPETFRKHKEAKKNYINTMLDNLNAMEEGNEALGIPAFANDPGAYFDIERLNAMAVKQMSQAMVESSYASDLLIYYDSRDDMIYHHLATAISTGKMHHFIDQLEDFKKLSDQELLEAFPTQKSEVKNGKLRKGFDKMIRRAEDVRDDYNALEDKFVNPFDPHKFSKGSREYDLEAVKYRATEFAKFLAIFQKQTFKRSLERYNSILKRLSANPIIGKMAANDIAVLTSLKNLKTEIETLKEELDQEPTTKELKAIQKKKIQRLRHLNNILDVLSNPMNWTDKSRGRKLHPKLKLPAHVTEMNPFYGTFRYKTDKPVKTGTTMVKDSKGVQYQVAWETYSDGVTLYNIRTTKIKNNQVFADKELTEKQADKLLGILTPSKGNIVYEGKFKGAEEIEADLKEGKGFSPIKSIETTVGVFHRGYLNKLRKPVVDFLKHIAETEEDFIDQEKIDDLLQDIVDYQFLKNRAGEYYKAIEVLLEPGRMDVLAERMAAVSMKRWENREVEVKARMEKYVGTIEKNEFMNQLAKEGIYADPDEVEVFLRDPHGPIPTDYMDEGGYITPDSHPNKYIRIQEIIKAYRSTQYTKKEAKPIDPATGEVVPTGIPNVDDIAANAIMPGTGIHPDTQIVLNNVYESLKKDENFNLTPEQWLDSKKAKGIIKARATLRDMYDKALSEKDKEIPSGEDANIKFEAWIKENLVEPEVYEVIDNEGLAYSDISVAETLKPETTKADKFAANERVINSEQGVVLKEVTIIDEDTNEERKYWQIVNTRNEDVFQQYKHLGMEPSYISKALAQEMFNKIIDNIPSDAEFSFDGQTFKRGMLIKQKSNPKKIYVVISHPTGIAKWGMLAVMPFTTRMVKGKSLAEQGGLKLDIGDWDSQGWEFHKTDMSTVGVQNKGQARLRMSEPVEIIAHEKGREEGETPEGVDAKNERLHHILRNLTPEELLQLEVIITPAGSRYSELMAIPPQERKAYEWGEGPNQQIRQGAHKFQIAIRFGSALAEKKMKEMEAAGISPAEVIGYIQGPTAATLLDDQGNYINPINITQKEVAQIFNYKGYTLEGATQAIQDAYISAQVLEQKAEDFLKGTDEAIITVADLQGQINFVITPGEVNYNKKEATKYSDLEFQYIDEADKIIWILNRYWTYKLDKHGNPVAEENITPITNLDVGQNKRKYAELKEIVQREMSGYKYIQTAGRYVAIVRMPNGTYTFIPLKGEQIPTKELDQIAKDIIKKQNETIAENLDDPEAVDRKAQDAQYTHKFNLEELEEKFYIVGQPGEIISIQLQSTGDIQIRYNNRKRRVGKAKEVFTTSFTISSNFIKSVIDQGLVPDVDTMANLVTVINHKITTSENKLQDTKKSDLVLKEDGFRRSIDKNADLVDSVIDKATTDVQNPIRKGMRMEARVPDASLSQVIKNTAVNPGETGTQEVEPEDIPEVEIPKPFEQQLAENFENVTAAQKTEIAHKIATEKPLSGQEELIYQAYEEEINAEATSIQEAGQPGAVETQDAENKTLADEWQKLKQEDITIKQNIKNKISVEAEDLGLDEANKSTIHLLATTQTDKNFIQSKLIEDGFSQELINLIHRKLDIKNAIKEVEVKMRGGAFKILGLNDDLRSTQQTENIEVFIAWAKKNLPDSITIDAIEKLGSNLATKGNITVGAFMIALTGIAGGLNVGGTIYTGARSPYKYHEAFHAIFRLLLTDEQIEHYLSLARKEVRAKLRKEGKNFQEELQKLRNTSPLYARLTSKELERIFYEEYLANEFEKFKQDPRSTKTNSENKSLFQIIIDWILNVLRFRSKNELTQLFKNIDAGKYRTESIKENAFVKDSFKGGPAQIALANIPMDRFLVPRETLTGTKMVPTTIYMPADRTRDIVGTIGKMYLVREMGMDFRKEAYNPAKILDEVVDTFINMYNPERKFYKDWENGSGIPYVDLIEDLVREYDALTNYRSEVRKAAAEFLEMFQIQDEEELYTEEIFEDTSLLRTGDWDKDASMIGGATSLPRMLRIFIATTTVPETDVFGNKYIPSEGRVASLVWNEATQEFIVEDNREPLAVPVDYLEAYNGLLKAVKDTTDPMEMLRKMYYFGEGNPQSRAVIKKIFDQIGITNKDVISGNLPEISDPGFFQAVVNGFNQYRVDYLFIQTDPITGITRLFAANNRDDQSVQVEQWQKVFSQKWNKFRVREAAKDETKSQEQQREKLNSSRLERREEIETMLEVFASYLIDEESITPHGAISDPKLEKLTKEIALELQEHLGIKLSPTYIAYSIARGITGTRTPKQEGLIATYEGDIIPIEKDDIIQIKNSIHRGEHLFLDRQGRGVIARLNRLAKGNAVLDETVGATVFRSPKGDWIYAHQMPSFHLEEVARLNTAEYTNEINGDLYLKDNPLWRDPRFEALRKKGVLRVMRISGSRNAVMQQDEEGDTVQDTSAQLKKEPGVAFGDSTGKEFVLNLINSYLYAYNDKNQKTQTFDYKNEKGEERIFTIAPAYIRVMAESSTGDMVSLPVKPRVEKDSDGNTVLTDTSVEEIQDALINELNRIARETNGHTEDEIRGYNVKPSDRAYTLHNTGSFVTTRNVSTKKRIVIDFPHMPAHVRTRFLEGNQRIIMRRPDAARGIGLLQGEDEVISTVSGDVTESFSIKLRGYVSIKDVDFNTIMNELGDAISDQKDKAHKWGFKVGNKMYWAEKEDQALFFKGANSQYIYEIIPIAEAGLEVGYDVEALEQPATPTEAGNLVPAFTGNVTQEMFGENQVMVFGANIGGFHGQGMAAFAYANDTENWRKHSPNLPEDVKSKRVGDFAIAGQTGFMQGNKGKGYGLVTVTRPGGRSLNNEELRSEISDFYKYAEANPHLEFIVPYNSDKNLNRKSLDELVKLFKEGFTIPSNVRFGDRMLDALKITQPAAPAEEVKTKGGFDSKGKGTPEGDGKDKAMREVADSAIVELVDDAKESSSKTTLEELGEIDYNSEVVMLARNGKLKGKPLKEETKQAIDEAHKLGASFVVGDMPGVDSQFIGYLQEIGADFTVYHTGKTLRKGAIPIQEEQVTPTEVESEIFELDVKLKEDLEKGAREGLTYDKILERIGKTREDVKAIIAERMQVEFREFLITLQNIKAYKREKKGTVVGAERTKRQGIANAIINGLRDQNGNISGATEQAMSLYNLREGDIEYNLAQIFFNDWLNTKWFNELLLGDQAMTLKDSVDQIKRAKMQNAAGPNASSMIAAPYKYNSKGDIIAGLGIDHPVKHMSMFLIDDPQYQKKYGVHAGGSYKEGGEETSKTGEKTDGQLWITIKAFKYMWFGLGRLTAAQEQMLRKVENGEELTADEWEGSKKKGTQGYKQLNAMINSKKLVYGDGKTYIKFSAFVLTKELTSRKNEKGEWVALENRKELHNLRVKLESWENRAEQEKRSDTIAIAAPTSAVKMLKKNVGGAESAFNEKPIDDVTGLSNHITELDAKYMRLQQVTPSNKLEIIDPTQIKSLISSEHKDDIIVVVGGVETTVGEIRRAYHKSVGDRVTLKYFGRRDLIFDLGTAQDELHKSIQLGGITANLRSFLIYAQVALKASQTRSQMLEFFELDESGEQKYDLNAPNTLQRFQELFLTYFSKKVLSEHIPGVSATLVSDKGMKVWKRVLSIDEETGQPERWEIIRTDQWKGMSSEKRNKILNAKRGKNKTTKLDFDNAKERTFLGLEVGDYYVDELRHNVKDFGKDGKQLDTVHSEFMVAPHHREILEKLFVTQKFKSKIDILKEFNTYVNEENWSPEARKDIIRRRIKNYDPIKAKIQFANTKGYVFDEFTREFEDQGNKIFRVIPEVIAKQFATRIPGQDKHSAINLKLVDFLPVFYGSSAVYAEDLLEISGADFDIDKLYMQIKEFYTVGDKFIEYGKGKTEDEKYADYIRYIIHESQKKDSLMGEALELWRSRDRGGGGIEDQTGVIDQFLDEKQIEEIIGPKPSEDASRGEKRAYNEKYAELFYQSLLRYGQESNKTVMRLWGRQVKRKNRGGLMGALEILHLPITKKEYTDYKRKHKREPYTAAINNDILDYKYALLGHPGMTEKQPGRLAATAYESATVDPLVEVWNFMKEEFPELAASVDEEHIDVDNMNGKVRAWINNKEGSRSIGAAVLPNISVNVLSEWGIKVRTKKDPKGRDLITQIRLNGVIYKDFDTIFAIDPKTKEQDPTGYRTQWVISALVTAMTDNAKERLAAKLGLNKDALAVTTILTALGVNIRTSILLVNHPTIKEKYFDALNKEVQTDPGVKVLLERQVQAIKKSFGMKKDYSVPVAVYDKLLIESIHKGDAAIFSQARKDKKEDPYTIDDANAEIAIIEQFLVAHNLNEYVRKMTALITLDKGFGRDTSVIDKRNIDIADLGIELDDKTFNETDIPIDVRGVFTEDSWRATYYKIYKEFTEELLPAVFMTRTPEFLKIRDILFENMTKDSRILTSEVKFAIEKDLVAYLTIKAYKHAASSNITLSGSLQNGFIYDQVPRDKKEKDKTLTIQGVVQFINNYLETAGPIDSDSGQPTRKPNYFIDYWAGLFTTSNIDNKTGINQIISNTLTKQTDSQLVDLQNSFMELYSDPILNPYAYHLMHYLLVKDGMQYRQGTIMDAFPPMMFDRVLQATAQAHHLLKFENKTDAQFKAVFGTTLPELFNEFTEGYLINNNSKRFIWEFKGTPELVVTGGTEQIRLQRGKYNRAAVVKSDDLYVFGEVQTESGETGHLNQMSIRGLTNVFPIRLKPNLNQGADGWFTDDNLEDLIKMVNADIKALISSGEGKKIVFPMRLFSAEDLKRIEIEAPEFYKHVTTQLEKHFGYSITGIPEKALDKNKKVIGEKAVYIHTGEKRLTVDVFAQVPVISGKTGRNVKEKIRTNNRWKEAKKIQSQITKNIKYLSNVGFSKTKTVYVGQGQATIEVGFPMYLKINMGDFRRVDWHYYKLTKLWTSRLGPQEGTAITDFIEEGDELAYGNRVHYQEVEILGSSAQSGAIPFIFGEYPTTNEIIEAVKSRSEDLFDELAYGMSDPDFEQITAVTDNIDEITKGIGIEEYTAATQTQEKKEADVARAVDDATEVDYVAGAGAQNMMVDATNIANVVGQKPLAPEKEEESTVEDKDFIQDESPPTGNVEIPEDVVIDANLLKQNLNPEGNNTPNQYSEITELWNSLTGNQKILLADAKAGIGRTSLDGLIEEYESLPFDQSEKDWVKNIKKCILGL